MRDTVLSDEFSREMKKGLTYYALAKQTRGWKWVTADQYISYCKRLYLGSTWDKAELKKIFSFLESDGLIQVFRDGYEEKYRVKRF